MSIYIFRGKIDQSIKLGGIFSVSGRFWPIFKKCLYFKAVEIISLQKNKTWQYFFFGLQWMADKKPIRRSHCCGIGHLNPLQAAGESLQCGISRLENRWFLLIPVRKWTFSGWSNQRAALRFQQNPKFSASRWTADCWLQKASFGSLGFPDEN